ncbi:Zn(II)2Cys6 transcription factor [Aspergillus pseudocaelatus]|uniref:Zn(II)2Cys6 transcription factor n=1 Tax=Aspergillus pseudocaelatus TaxID=1825620 RepID=A0ABQ6W489_9EURO|nr:Zn(II)2Cys6 transcription factor [Aspergillus pseudocaelatus]
MPMQPLIKSNVNQPRIRRTHSGCRPCRKRGKRCDEARPSCQACKRLSLDCSYGIDYTFRNLDGALFQRQLAGQTTSTRSSPISKRSTAKRVLDPKIKIGMLNHLSRLETPSVPLTVSTHHEVEVRYLNHFQTHVRHLLPAASLEFINRSLQSPALRFAVLCISASNLSMLNSRVQNRILPNDSRKSVHSPLVNGLHHSFAQKYHDLAFWNCRAAEADEIKNEAPALLVAHVLLAYYHHASTDHLQFRIAVRDAVRFVLQSRTNIVDSADGVDSLQMWYRLCTSHRPAKPPALLLEGEGASSFGPNLLPDVTEHLYLNCILGMSVNDLIYDILIKTLEIRTKLMVFRCVAAIRQVSETSRDIGPLAHEMMNKMLGRECGPDEYVEARDSFVRGSNLLGLLDVQKERLKVWRSRLSPGQLQTQYGSISSIQSQGSPEDSHLLTSQRTQTHRDVMNALYCLLCEMTFEEAKQAFTSHHTSTVVGVDPSNPIANMAYSAYHIADSLNLAVSNTSDVYTMSLAEVLLQLVFLWRSDELFHYILDILWPRLEAHGRGYEHSHYPTHLVKRIITQAAVYWEQGRVVNFALPAVAEDTSKLKLLDIDHPVDLVVCGYNTDGMYFIEKGPLP